MRNFLRVSVVLMGLLMLLQPTFASGQFMMMENPLIGTEAPNFKLMTLSGKEVSSQEYRNGQKAIIFFWATWCPH